VDRDAIYRAIRRRFNVRVNGDNLPIVSKHGTRLDLADLWGELGYRRMAEIGVRRGSYSHELLTRVPESHLTCVDIWAPYYNRSITADRQEAYYQETLRKLSAFAERVTIRRASSMDVVREIQDGSLDAVFIDGDHTFDGAVMDIVCWSRKVRSGGMVGVHDYYPMARGGVVQAVDGYTHCHKIDPWYVTHELESTAFWVVP
jgi:predicted O-methyltransferase YrrM